MITFDPDALATRIGELEARMGAPGFWDDQAEAASVSAEHARLSKRLERYERLNREFEDASELAGLDGGDMEDEIASSLEPVRRDLERLQEDALFSGEYDSGDAVVTIHGGEGGTATAVKTIVNEAPRVGRNDPCPCGSGKKYKKCHGA